MNKKLQKKCRDYVANCSAQMGKPVVRKYLVSRRECGDQAADESGVIAENLKTLEVE